MVQAIKTGTSGEVILYHQQVEDLLAAPATFDPKHEYFSRYSNNIYLQEFGETTAPIYQSGWVGIDNMQSIINDAIAYGMNVVVRDVNDEENYESAGHVLASFRRVEGYIEESRKLYYVTAPGHHNTTRMYGTIALTPLDDSCGGCNGVTILEVVDGLVTASYVVNGRSILAGDNAEDGFYILPKKFKARFFPGKDVYWAAAQYSGNCSFCGFDGCEYLIDFGARSLINYGYLIWQTSSLTSTYEGLDADKTYTLEINKRPLLAFTDAIGAAIKTPGYEDAIPLIWEASKLRDKRNNAPCDDDLEFIDFDTLCY